MSFWEGLERTAIKSAKGLMAWATTYAYILTKGDEDGDEGAELVQFVPNVLQKRLFRAVELCIANNWPVRIILLKKRQGGGSTGCALAFYWLLRRARANSMIIGALKWQSGNLMEIINTLRQNDRFNWGHDFKYGAEVCTMSHGGRLQKGTANQPESCRSATLRMLLMTEVARWAREGVRGAERIISGASASIPKLPGTAIFQDSTSNGPVGQFYKRWYKSLTLEDIEAGKRPRPGQYIRIFAGCHEHADSYMRMTEEEREELLGSIDEEEQAILDRYGDDLRKLGDPMEFLWWRRATIENDCEGDPDIFKRDFPMNPEEAFLATSGSFFYRPSLAKMRKIAEAREADKIVGDLQMSDDRRRTMLVPTRPKDAHWWQYEPPVPGQRYWISADFMEGVATDEKGDDRDHHAILVHRAGYHGERGWVRQAVVARSALSLPGHPCQWDLDIVEDYIEAAAKLYGNCLIVPENNKDGGVIRNLVNRGLNVYQQMTGQDTNGESVKAKPSGKYGFKTVGGESEGTRKAILNDLKLQVREMDAVGMGIDVDLRTVEEMEMFILNLKGKGEAMEGQHDDSVMALAIGNFTRAMGTLYVPSPHDAANWYSNDPLLRERFGGGYSGAASGSSGGFGL